MILAGAGGIILLLVIAVIAGRRVGVGDVRLSVWGVLDDADAYAEIFSAFERETGVSVEFTRKDIATYENELINALAAGRGPDVFMVNNAWLGEHSNKLVPAPARVITPARVREIYPDVVADDFVFDGRVWALPLSVDTLALFYNRALFDRAGIPLPPATWRELTDAVPKLTRFGRRGALERSAVAMGTGLNTNHAADILSALMLQAGTPIVDNQTLEAVFHRAEWAEPRSAGETALEFYLQFANPATLVYTWNAARPDSMDAFAEGTLAMMFSYASHIPEILEKGPRVDFVVAPLPQHVGIVDRVDFANYWAFGVSIHSLNRFEAWQLIAFMTSKDQAAAYFEATGRPPARRDLIRLALNQPTAGVFARQALTAKSWFQPDAEEAESIFTAMIESARKREVAAQVAVSRAASRINLLLEEFRR